MQGISAPDPFVIGDENFYFGGVLQNTARAQTSGLTLRSQTYNPAQKTLCLITAGQSLATNYTPSAYTVTNGSAIDQMNIYDGACYSTAGQLLGTQDLPGELGNLAGRLADKAIAGGFNRVIIMCTAIGGSMASDWATGALKNKLPVAIKRFISRGFIPGNTGLTFAISWWQGETDNTNNTSQASYQASMATIKSNLQAAGFTGSSCRFFVNLETWDGSTTDANIRAAQAAVVDGSFYFAGADLDTLTAIANRQAVGNPHLSDVGADSGTTLAWNAMHASGAPY